MDELKVRAYFRVAHDVRTRRTQVQANAKPTTRPLTNTGGAFLPTVAFAVDLEIPDALFKRAEQVIATLALSDDSAVIAATVTENPPP